MLRKCQLKILSLEITWPNYEEVKNEKLIVAIDFGVKNILRLLRKHVGKVQVVNAEICFDELMQFKPDGVFLSNGPGDPGLVFMQ